MTPFSERIITTRESLDMNKAEFARAIGVSKTTVGKWESGASSTLKPEHLFKIASLTGFSAKWVSSGKGPQKGEPDNGTKETKGNYSSATGPFAPSELMGKLSQSDKDELWNLIGMEKALASKKE